MGKLALAIFVVLSGCLVEEAEVADLEQDLAAENAIYQNGTYLDSTYANGTFENGYAIIDSDATTVASWERPWARGWTGPKANGFSVAYAKRWGANFYTNQWVQNVTQFQYVDGNGSTCAHPTTQIGNALASTCSQLVQQVCTADPTCCNSIWGTWDQTCINLAADLSNDYSGSHATSMAGPGLIDSHSGCAARVNLERSSCRTNWTSACVDDAFAKCYARYVTFPRIEGNRLMANACVEPLTTGTAGCTTARPGSTPAECCRRSLVLYGVYQDFHKDDPTLSGHGHKVQWSSKEPETTPAGATSVNATMVPDPCTGSYYASGQTMVRLCAPEHHLWQLAGPGEPFYPDVVNTANTIASEGNLVDAGHRNVRRRNVLVNLLTGLINTSGSYTIDLRYVDYFKSVLGSAWRDSADTGYLPPDTSYANRTELIIDDTSIVDPNNFTRHYIYGHVLCKVNATRTDTGAPPCSTLDYTLPRNQGKDSTIRTLWELL